MPSAVDDGFAFGRLDLLVAAIGPHFPGIDVVAQLQLQDVGELFHQYRVLHPHAHFHAHSVLRVRKSPEAM